MLLVSFVLLSFFVCLFLFELQKLVLHPPSEVFWSSLLFSFCLLLYFLRLALTYIGFVDEICLILNATHTTEKLTKTSHASLLICSLLLVELLFHRCNELPLFLYLKLLHVTRRHERLGSVARF